MTSYIHGNILLLPRGTGQTTLNIWRFTIILPYKISLLWVSPSRKQSEIYTSEIHEFKLPKMTDCSALCIVIITLFCMVIRLRHYFNRDFQLTTSSWTKKKSCHSASFWFRVVVLISWSTFSWRFSGMLSFSAFIWYVRCFEQQYRYFPGHVHAFYLEYVYYHRQKMGATGMVYNKPATGVYSDRIQNGGRHVDAYPHTAPPHQTTTYGTVPA